MEQPHEWSGDVATRLSHWVERFYVENLDRVAEPAFREFGQQRVDDLVTELTYAVVQKAAEQFSQKEIDQFLAAIAQERRYDEVQQFCRQISECQQFWSILTESGKRDGPSSAVDNGPEHALCPRRRSANGRALRAAVGPYGL